MAHDEVNVIELQQQALRTELKAWERKFAEANDGRKAGKDDIKQAPEIAAKYKEYNKLRRKAGNVEEQTVSTPKRSRVRRSITTIENDLPLQHPAAMDPYDIPQALTITPRIVRTAIGPTPQKNGQVLGLFDLLSPYSVKTTTPSKSKVQASSNVPALTQTPSRSRSVFLSHHVPPPAISTGSAKRRKLDHTQTPSSQRQQVLTELTPISSRLNKAVPVDLDQTPAFLKRFSEPSSFVGAEDLGKDIAYSPPRMRLPRKPIGRSLSQLVRSLREQEDERLDDELALMREMETGEPAPALKPRPKLLVQDSQIGIELPLGADGEHEFETEQQAGQASNTEARRLWRKKGQKRTTRRANIGVNTAKWQPETQWTAGEPEDGDERVTETQAVSGEGAEHTRNEASNDDEYRQSDPSRTTTAAAQTGVNTESDKAVKKKRKINPNATAHANFRSLKIRNKNSKGRGRFGRR